MWFLLDSLLELRASLIGVSAQHIYNYLYRELGNLNRQCLGSYCSQQKTICLSCLLPINGLNFMMRVFSHVTISNLISTHHYSFLCDS